MTTDMNRYIFPLPTGAKRQRGLSLIELMIAVAIGLIILAALTALFVSQSRARSELDKSNRMIDNGRYAMDIVASNLRVAGFYDVYVPSGVATATEDPCDVAALLDPAKNLNILRHHVQGYHASTPSSDPASGVIASGNLPANCAFTYVAGSNTSLKAGSDILVLRRVSTAPPVPTPNTTSIYLQASKCVTDATKYQIDKTKNPSIRIKDCATVADLRLFVVQIYFISPDNVADDGIPTLKRLELDVNGAFTVTPLVEGIEYMRIDYGVDADGDGAPDGAYVSEPTTAQWPNVTSIRVNILARNTERTTGQQDNKKFLMGLAGEYPATNDAYKRHVFSQVIRLVNPSSRRELP